MKKSVKILFVIGIIFFFVALFFYLIGKHGWILTLLIYIALFGSYLSIFETNQAKEKLLEMSSDFVDIMNKTVDDFKDYLAAKR